jgi:multimeric flavodoxin WrbA
MNVTILNGSNQPHHLPGLQNQIEEKLGNSHNYAQFNLADFTIKQCIGCWNCWCKTPGVCVHKDDAVPLMRSVINADLVVFASPVMRGFTGSLLKRFQDRMIVLIHPYLELVEKECHHRKRYDRYPDIALFIEKEADTDEEDIDIITTIYKRLALNFHCSLKHVWITEPEPEEKAL